MNYKSVSTSIGGVIILILSIISFIFLPTMVQTGGRATTLGKWGRISIQNTENSEFTNQYRNLAGYAESQNLIPSDDFSRTSFYHSLAKVAFNSSVIDVAMTDELERAGYVPSDFLVNKELVKYYLDENEMYSETKFQSTPANTRLSYKKAVEHSMIARRYVEDIFGDGKKGGMKMSASETAFIEEMAKKVRDFKYVSFGFDSYPKEKIKEYGMEKAELYKTYDFSLLSYETEEEAKNVLSSLKDGSKSFEDALKEIENKKLTNDDGKLEKATREDIADIFPDNADLDKVVALKSGDISDVLQTSEMDYVIIRCDGDAKEADFDSEEVQNKVFAKIKSEDRGKIEEYLLEKGKEFVEKAKKDGFDVVSSEYNKETILSQPFSLNYGSLSYFPSISTDKDSVLSPASKNEEFYKDVFSLKDGEISSPHLLASNVVILSQNSEKDSDEYVKDNGKTYKNQCENYMPYYNLVMLLQARGMNFYTIPLAQKTFIDFILKNPKLVDNHTSLFDRDEQ
ncbi:MAG: peptidylprolyl isomerase [Treponema sp.]